MRPYDRDIRHKHSVMLTAEEIKLVIEQLGKHFGVQVYRPELIEVFVEALWQHEREELVP